MPTVKNPPADTANDDDTCKVEMTCAQAALISRALRVLLEQDEACDTLTEDEREEVQALADIAAAINPNVINVWCF